MLNLPYYLQMSNGYYHPTWQHVIGALATAYSIGCGYGITSPTLEFIKNENDKQFYASCINLGVIFGALFCGITLDKKTRTLRKALSFSIIPAVVGWMLMILSEVESKKIPKIFDFHSIIRFNFLMFFTSWFNQSKKP